MVRYLLDVDSMAEIKENIQLVHEILCKIHSRFRELQEEGTFAMGIEQSLAVHCSRNLSENPVPTNHYMKIMRVIENQRNI